MPKSSPPKIAPRGRGHSRQLDRAKIVSAALALSREKGLKRLSMRGVAGSLGVDPAALYWHFDNKEALLAEVEAAAAADVSLEEPTEGGWRERCLAACRQIRAELMAHPELAVREASSQSPFYAESSGLVARILAGSGLRGRDLIYASQTVMAAVASLARQESEVAGSRPDDVRQFVGTLARHLPDDATAEWIAMARQGTAVFDEYLDASIGFILDGIEASVGSD